jgi:hypothetical protein
MTENNNKKRCFSGVEPAEFIAPDDWTSAIIRLTCVLIIGLVIMQGIFVASNITANSAFYSAYAITVDNVKSGYTLASLMVMIVGDAAILHFLGFM